MADGRRSELAQRLHNVRRQIDVAAEGCGRSACDIVLVVVTKTWPTSDIRALYDLGVRDVGENRHQEAEQKASELDDLDLTWHFIGQVQSNKTARIATYADAVHSVGSVKVAGRLDDAARQLARVVDCFVQVNLDAQPERAGRGGVTGADVMAVADALESAGALRLRGVMGVAPQHGDAESAYRELASVGRLLQREHPLATAMSAGMSGDLSEAVRAGATHVRVGSAVLGQRPPLG